MSTTAVEERTGDDIDAAREKTRRRRVLRNNEIAVILANAVGAAVAQMYFIIAGTLELGPDPTGKVTPTSSAGITVMLSIAGVAILLFLGVNMGGRRERALHDWYLHPGERDRIPSPEIQKQALTSPIHTTLVSLAMWVLAGIIFGSTGTRVSTSEGYAVNLQSALSMMLAITGLPGAISATLVYFISERLWQPEIPIFFPDGNVSQMHAFRMTVRRRILVLFLVQTMPLLVLAMAAYQQAAGIARADDPMALLPRFLRLEAFIVGVGALAALTLVFTLGHYLISSVEALNDKMGLVRRGDLKATLPVTSNDEFGELAEGFNAMVAGLQQEEVVRHLFSLYVTPEVAEHAIEHGAALGGQLAPATVLFSDIRGFTSLTEQSDPQILIAMLNRYFQTMSAIIVSNGGFVNKFGGDSLLAVFGTPLNPLPDHPDRAVLAAREMQHALKAFNADQAMRGEPTVRCGIGIATGPVVAGNVGSQERLEYTVIGDTVNLASRLEAMTKTHNAGVLISGATAAALTDTLGLSRVGEVEVRGKQQPVPVYTIPQGASLHA